MGTFIADGASVLPVTKTNASAPTGATTEFAAGDSNQFREALLDVRTAVIAKGDGTVTSVTASSTGNALAIIGDPSTTPEVYLGLATSLITGAMSAADKAKLDKYPGVGSGTATYLRNDGSWATPSSGGGSGTVTSVSSSTAALTVANPTTTPALTIANVVVSGASGLMTGSDKYKLDGIASGATANTGTVTSVSSSTTALVVTTGTTTPSLSIANAVAGGASGLLTGSDKTKLDAATTSSTASTLALRDSSGDLYAHDFVATSDERLKTQIEPIENALSKVLSLQGKTFEWKTDPGEKRIGLIAQQVLQIVPEAVTQAEYYGVSYGSLVALLIEAVKTLSERIAVLEAK